MSRFELTTNTTAIGNKNAVSLYAILIIPILLGNTFFYYTLELRGFSFGVALIVLISSLINIYIFYKRYIYQQDILKLLVDNKYIQVMDHKKIQFQAQVKDINIEIIRCGRQDYPAIKISNEELPAIIIGLKQPLETLNEKTTQPLNQPDYWLNQEQWQILYMRLTKTNRRHNFQFT